MSLRRSIGRVLAPILALAVAGSLVAVTAPTSSADDGKRPDIVGGSTTNTAKYPWQVRLIVQTNEGSFLCGGAIIHSRIVLTAAHCLVGAIGVTAYFGRDLADSGGVEAAAVSGYTAASYNPNNFENDFATVYFDSPIPSVFTPIKIAGASEKPLWRAGRVATAVGFGNVTEGGSTSPTLQEVPMPLQADSTCARSDVYGTSFFPASMMCAAGMAGGRSTCQGDSGGPLVVPGDNGVWRIAGIVSWAEGCARPNKPTVFTRIAEPTMAARLVEQVQQAKTANPSLFPGAESTISILGSGAVPPGCTAAKSTAGKAATKVTSTQKAATKAGKTLKKAAKQQKAASAKLKKLKKQRASKSAIAKATKAQKAATKKAATATKKSKAAKKSAAAAKRASAAAAAAAQRACS